MGRPIADAIQGKIADSDFVIAGLTRNSLNVVYEFGFVTAMGKHPSNNIFSN